MKSKIILLISIFSCFWIFHFAFQQKTIYSHSLGKISSNWENKDGNRILAQTPYQKINNQSLIHWMQLTTSQLKTMVTIYQKLEEITFSHFSLYFQ